jgi:hypothetical protein
VCSDASAKSPRRDDGVGFPAEVFLQTLSERFLSSKRGSFLVRVFVAGG